MDAPQNYNVDVQGPFMGALQGYQAGAAIQQNQLQQQQQQIAIQQQQQSMQAVRGLLSNPNPTPQDFANATLAVPGMREQFKQALDIRTTQRQQATLSHLGDVYTAIQNGQPQVAADLLQQRVDALTNSGGAPDQIQAAQNMMQLVKQSPNFAAKMVGMRLAFVPGGDKVIEASNALQAGQRAQDQAPADLAKKTADATVALAAAGVAPQKAAAEVANLNSTIDERSRRLALDRDKLATDTQLTLQKYQLEYGLPPDDARKIINESVVNGTAAAQSADRLNGLADQMQQANLTGALAGGAGAIDEFYKKITGQADGISSLRADYARLANVAAIKSLKEGGISRFTDADLKVALQGVPTANDGAERITSFLRGMAKMQQLESATENAKQAWVGQNRMLGNATKDLNVNGIQVPRGTSFADFSKQYVTAQAKQMSAADFVNRVNAQLGTAPAQPPPVAPVVPDPNMTGQ